MSKKLRPEHIDLLTHYAKGKTLKEIAPTMFKSTKTVATYSEQIRDYFKAGNLAQATIIAFKEGIIQ